jgi:hypothetical protein
MPRFTLADVDHLPANVSRARADQFISKVPQSIPIRRPNAEILQTDGNAIIDGVLNDEGLTVSLRSSNPRRTLQEQFCVRLNTQELPKISGVPDHTNRFCDVSAGETSEGLALVIESHRCYTADLQGNASASKVRMNISYLAFH